MNIIPTRMKAYVRPPKPVDEPEPTNTDTSVKNDPPKVILPEKLEPKDDGATTEKIVLNDEKLFNVIRADDDDHIDQNLPKKEKEKKKKQLSSKQRMHLERIRVLATAKREQKKLATAEARVLKKAEKDKQKELQYEEKKAKQNMKRQQDTAKSDELREQQLKKNQSYNDNMMNLLDKWYDKKQVAKKARKAKLPQKNTVIAKETKTRQPVVQQQRSVLPKTVIKPQYLCKSRFRPFQ